MITRAAKKGPTWTPLPATLVAVVLTVVAIFILFEPISIDGASMEPGIERGSTVVVFRAAYGVRLPFSDQYIVQWNSPERDDIIVLKAPDTTQKLVKRVALAEDERIQIYGDIMTLTNSSVILDPQVTQELLRYPRMPFGFVFVTGDNVPISRDSRHFGFVSHSDVLGRVILSSQISAHAKDEQ